MYGITDSESDNMAETALLYIHPQTPPPVVPITGGGEGVEKNKGSGYNANDSGGPAVFRLHRSGW